MRALALTGLDRRRLEQDQRTFTLSDAAVEFQEMGYDLVPRRDAHARYCNYLIWQRTSEHGRSVRVELQTRCGCTRQMFVAYPPQRTLRIPILKDPQVAVALSATVPIDAIAPIVSRDFELYEQIVDNGIPWFRYREVP